MNLSNFKTLIILKTGILIFFIFSLLFYLPSLSISIADVQLGFSCFSF